MSHLGHDLGWSAYRLGLEQLDGVAAANHCDALGELRSELAPRAHLSE
jgi:hypothetical protein